MRKKLLTASPIDGFNGRIKHPIFRQEASLLKEGVGQLRAAKVGRRTAVVDARAYRQRSHETPVATIAISESMIA
jgi:hypothetical protein